MRLLRIPVTLALSALTAVALAVPAQASTCNLLVDVAGDGIWSLGAGVVNSPQLDIRSGDVASGATTVVAVLRMTSLVDNVYSQLGPGWSIGWRINGHAYTADLRRGIGPNPNYIATFESPSGTVITPAWSYDLGTGVITWTIPRAALPDLATPGQTFTDIAAATRLLSYSADQANSTATYVDQTASCVPAS
jgi:hypothetical protein